jgi:hypothetical protein
VNELWPFLHHATGGTPIPTLTATAAFHNRIELAVDAMSPDTLAHEFLHVLLNDIHVVGSPLSDFMHEHGINKNLWSPRTSPTMDIFIRTRINDPMLYRIHLMLPP